MLVFVECWLTAFILTSSRASKPFSSNFFPKRVTTCSFVRFSKWAWFVDSFRCRGNLAKWIVRWWRGQLFRMRFRPAFERLQENLLTISLLDWRKVSGSSVSLSPSSVVLRTSFKTAKNSPRFSWVGPLVLLSDCSSSLFMRERKQLVLSTSVNWMQILRFVWKRSSNSSNFSDFPSHVGIVVVTDFGHLETLLMLLRKFAELLMFANCWRSNYWRTYCF